MKSAQLAYIGSIIPGLGHYYLHRYLRGMFFTGTAVLLLVILVYAFNLPNDAQEPIFVIIPIDLIIGLIYSSAADVENVCIDIRKGRYGRKIQVDDSKDPDSQGGMYCVSFYLVGAIAIFTAIAIGLGCGWIPALECVLFGIIMIVIGYIVMMHVDSKNECISEE